MWDADRAGYVDPKTGQPLPTWTEATTAIADDAEPAYVARLGSIDPREMRGVEAGTPDAERAIRYVTKYVTKNLADTAAPRGDHARAHFDRLHAELAILPCSPSCANWLLYGVQPDNTKPGLVPGRCTGKVHQADTLGFTGRRVLISRNWSGKTLTDHRHDNHTWVKAILAGHLADGNDAPGRRAQPTRPLHLRTRPTRRPRRTTASTPTPTHHPPTHHLERSPRQSTRREPPTLFRQHKINRRRARPDRRDG